MRKVSVTDKVFDLIEYYRKKHKLAQYEAVYSLIESSVNAKVNGQDKQQEKKEEVLGLKDLIIKYLELDGLSKKRFNSLVQHIEADPEKRDEFLKNV